MTTSLLDVRHGSHCRLDSLECLLVVGVLVDPHPDAGGVDVRQAVTSDRASHVRTDTVHTRQAVNVSLSPVAVEVISSFEVPGLPDSSTSTSWSSNSGTGDVPVNGRTAIAIRAHTPATANSGDAVPADALECRQVPGPEPGVPGRFGLRSVATAPSGTRSVPG